MRKALTRRTTSHPSPGFAVPVPAFLFIGRACCHALILADGVGQRRPDLFRELQLLFYVCDLIKKARKDSEYSPQTLSLSTQGHNTGEGERICGRASTNSLSV